jgi:hypothetical protein
VKFFTFQASSFARKSWFYFFRTQEQDDLFILSSRSILFMEHDLFFATPPMPAPMIATVGRALLPSNAASKVLIPSRAARLPRSSVFPSPPACKRLVPMILRYRGEREER